MTSSGFPVLKIFRRVRLLLSYPGSVAHSSEVVRKLTVNLRLLLQVILKFNSQSVGHSQQLDTVSQCDYG
jgi:hypothetical protein